jgi:hypothetical protein
VSDEPSKPTDKIQIRLFPQPSIEVGMKPNVMRVETHAIDPENKKPTGEIYRVADEEVIWRYMSLARFVAMLHTSSLWLSRVDLLGDHHEGAAPKSDLDSRRDAPMFERVWAASRRWNIAVGTHLGMKHFRCGEAM